LKKSILILALLFAIAIAVPLSAAETAGDDPLTLEQALEIAFQNSPQIKLAYDQVEKSRGGVREARANLLPKFDTEITHTRQGPTVSFGGQSIVRDHDTSASASVFVPVDVSKQFAHVTGISKYQYETDRLGLLAAQQQLILDVKTAYLDVLRARGGLEVAQAAYDAAQARLKNTQIKFEVGDVAKFDVTRDSVEVANLEQGLLAAKNGVRTATSAFNRVLGIDVSAPTHIADIDIPVSDSPVEMEESIVRALENRPEIQQAHIGIQAGEKNVKLTRTEIRPSADITGAYNYAYRASGFSSQKDSWVAFLTFRVPIWDGGVTKAKVDQAHADLQAAKDGLMEAELGVALEVRVAALDMQESAERVDTAKQNLALAEEAARLANVRRDAGVSILVEVIDAESALTEARFNYVNARYDYAVARAQYEKAVAAQPEMETMQLVGAGS